MPFDKPSLDDRQFQDIVDELKKRIPLYCPEWTDHNVSDPGVTLIELFAYMMEQVLYRMNQLPLRHYLTFAQFIGVPIPTPQPARAAVTFRLTKPINIKANSKEELIEAGTEVSTTQTETIPPYVFTTQEDAKILAPKLKALIRKKRGDENEEVMSRSVWDSDEDSGFKLFSDKPLINDEFHFEFENDLSHHLLCLKLHFFDRLGRSINVNNPPIELQAYTSHDHWETIPREDWQDTTKGLNDWGKFEVHLPAMAPYKPSGSKETGYRIRLRITRAEYQASPELRWVEEVSALGRTVKTEYLQVEKDDFLGISDGSAGQRFALSHSSIVLPLDEAAEKIWVGDDEWSYVDHFAYPDTPKQEEAKVFTIDVTTNEVRFPPALPMPNGKLVRYGKVPPRDAEIYFTQYRFIDTSELEHAQRTSLLEADVLDVPSQAINTLKSSIPYISRVENRKPAMGGSIFSIEALEMEVQRFLRFHRNSNLVEATTAGDYEWLVFDQFRDQVSKVECKRLDIEGNKTTVSQSDNTIYVFVVARIPPSALVISTRSDEALRVTEDILHKIEKYLYIQRLLTDTQWLRISVNNPNYVRIHTQISVACPESEVRRSEIRNLVRTYLHPVWGSPSGRGWRLGDTIQQADMRVWLEEKLQGTELREIQLTSSVPERGGDPINLAWNELIIPGQITITFE